MLFPDETRDDSLAKIRRALTERWDVVEIPIQRKDGETRVALWNSANVYAEDGTTILATIAQGQDITRRKQAEDALRQSEEQFRALAEAMTNLAWWANADGYITWYNRRWYEYTGATPEQMEGWGWQSVHDPQALPAVMERWKASIATGEPFDMTFPLRGADGRFRRFLTRAMPLKDAQGRVVRWFGTNTDVEELTRAEEALRQSEERYRTAFSAMNEGFCIVEVVFDAHTRPIDYRFLEINSAFEAQTGLHDAQGKLMRELAPDHEARWFELYGQIALTGAPAHFVNEARALGRWYEVSAYRVGGAESRKVAILFNDITQRKRAEEELLAAKLVAERAQAAAESASKAKDHFLAVLSHELRNPLNPVLATASLLRGDGRLDADVREQLEVIYRNAELEARLIDDLLDVTRIERGKVELDRRPLELGTVIQRAVEVCRPDIQARQLEFGVEMGGDGPYWVEADAARLQQVFWNLLKNAIKFTPQGGSVGVRCRRDGGGFVVAEVHDSGVGIPEEALGRIFLAFEQAERSFARRFGGLGLGLAISKALVELHGGTIQAHSEGMGKGATFTVRLPLIPVPAAGAASSASPAPVAAAAVRPLRILLVEDHDDTARVMRRVLASQGHEVETAADVATALELARKRPFDLLLSDLGLPDGSGVDLMRSLRAAGIGMPGVALSGYGQEQDVAQSRAAGFAAHLTKPVNLSALLATIVRVTQESQGR